VNQKTAAKVHKESTAERTSICNGKALWNKYDK